MTCPQCNTSNQADARFCRGCGSALAAASRQASAGAKPGLGNVCSQCGASNLRSAQKCSNCGVSLQDAPAPKTPAQKDSDADRTVAYSSGAADSPAVVFRLIRKNLDGVVQDERTLEEAETIIGRIEGNLTCPSDVKMSRRHARLLHRDGRLLLSDMKSTNGTYLRLRTSHKLCWGDIILAGNEMLRFDEPSGAPAGGGQAADATLLFGQEVSGGEFNLVDAHGKVLRTFPLEDFPAVIGRGQVEISFPNDTGLAERHAQVMQRGDGLYLEDLGSSRGNFLWIQKEIELKEGDQFLVGEQVFEISTGEPNR